jgi:hypothetical protein
MLLVSEVKENCSNESKISRKEKRTKCLLKLRERNPRSGHFSFSDESDSLVSISMNEESRTRTTFLLLSQRRPSTSLKDEDEDEGLQMKRRGAFFRSLNEESMFLLQSGQKGKKTDAASHT